MTGLWSVIASVSVIAKAESYARRVWQPLGTRGNLNPKKGQLSPPFLSITISQLLLLLKQLVDNRLELLKWLGARN